MWMLNNGQDAYNVCKKKSFLVRGSRMRKDLRTDKLRKRTSGLFWLDLRNVRKW